MLRILIFLFLTFSVTCHASGSNWPPGSIQWYVEKWNNQDQRRRIASPNYQRQIETRRLLDRSFSTATRPVGSTGLPTYQPQRITPQSFARGMFNALVRKHPVATAAILAAGAYECLNSETGFCIGQNPDEQPEPIPDHARCPDGGTYQVIDGIAMCTVPAGYGEQYKVIFRQQNFLGRTPIDACSLAASAMTSYRNSLNSETERNFSFTFTSAHSGSCFGTSSHQILARVNGNYTWVDTSTNISHPYSNAGSDFYCPPDDNPSFIKTYPAGDSFLCWKDPLLVLPGEQGRPITLEDLGYTGYVSDLLPSIQEVDEDILKDPATGKPNADFFDNPKSTPISPRLSDAFTDVASGVAQSNNPSAPHYYPPDVINDIIEAREKFHKREPFVDPLTNTTVTPDPGENTVNPPYAPPVTVNLEGLVVEVEVDMNWDEFPGITQEQYEQSNDKLSDAYDSVELPDFESIDGDFIDTISQNPDLPFSPFNFGDIWPIQGGQCTGFDVSMSVRGETKQVTMDKHCPPYNEWAHPLIAWFLQLLTLLHIFHLFSRMISAG